MRKIARTDSNQKEIVKQLRKIGCSVQILSTIGSGCPDILCGFKGNNYLFEIKDGNNTPSKKRLTKDEQKWFDRWKGQINKIENFDEILKIINL